MKKHEVKKLLNLIKKRHQLKKIKEYKEADEIRKQIGKMNFKIEDVEYGCIRLYKRVSDVMFLNYWHFWGEINPEDIDKI